MNKIIKTCLCFAMLTYCTKSTAQIDTSTNQKLLQYIMQPLDKNQISTGFLEEYGCPILPPATFNGTLTDSNNIDMNLWRSLYHQLQTAWTRTTANPLPVITSVNTTIKQNTSSALPVSIPLIITQYNNVKSNAFSSNLLSYNSSTNRVSDVVGRTQSPYNLKNLFAGCPNINQSLSGTDSFIIKSNMIWNNTGKTINQIQIDFANGQGFQTVAIGISKSISYADTGLKRWTIKVTLSDNSILQCYSNYQVLRTPNFTARFQSPQIVFPAWGFINAVAGVRSAATVRINYSNNNRTSTLRKPLIVVEGYDVSTIAPTLQPFNYSVVDFIAAINEPRVTYDFNSQLDDIAGYDLVFIDFADGAADIVLNAGAVQEVIRQVNLNKVNDNRFGNIRQQNVVMGLSMGGLCARFALANITKNFPGTPTETRLLITHDSPHQGANVPLGLQYLLRMVGNINLFGNTITDIYPNYFDAIGLLNAPATQQLLTYRSLTENTFAANAFLNGAYRTMITFNTTDPQPTYRFIATSLGNECANPLFNPYRQMLNVSLDGFIFYFPLVSYRLRVIAEAFALPSTGSTNKIARFKMSSKFKLFAFITISKDFYDNTAYAPGSQLPIDGAPGAITEYASTTVPSYNFLFPIPGIFGFLGYVSASTSGTPGRFTFVPVPSALDAAPYNSNIFSQRYVNGVNQNFPSTSATFIAQETNAGAGTTNNVHIRFTARNSRWLFNEMENLANLENCSAECSNPFYVAGLDLICNTGTYSVPGLQRGVTISWTVSPTGLATISGTGNLITLTRNGTSNGIITLTANLGAGCNSAQAISKQVAIGTAITGYYTINSNYHQPLQRQLFTNNSPIWLPANQYFGVTAVVTGANLTSNIWNRDASSYPFTWSTSGTTLNFSGNAGTTPYTQRNGIFSLTAQNACGTATQNFLWPVIVQSGSFMVGVSPNPAGDEINVTANATTAQKDISTNTSALGKTGQKQVNETIHPKIMSIKITDVSGNLKAQYNYNKIGGLSSVKLNISTLPIGTYTLSIFNGNQWSSQNFIKQ